MRRKIRFFKYLSLFLYVIGSMEGNEPTKKKISPYDMTSKDNPVNLISTTVRIK